MKKRLLTILLILSLIFIISLPAFAIDYDESIPRVVDEADLFTDSEEKLLTEEIAECIESYETDLVIATVTSTDGKDIDSFTEDYYDYNGYGIGDNYDGIIMLISIEPGNHQYSIITTGKEIADFSDGYIEYMYDKTGSDLSDGDYYGAAETFIDLSIDAFKGDADYNSYYDIYNYNSDGDYSYSGDERTISEGAYIRNTILERFGIALIIGVIISLVITGTMKNNMKPVRVATSARNYLVDNSVNIYRHNEIFIRSDVTKTKIERSESSSGGGSSHTGSSGRSHGGGGGRNF